MKLNLKELGPPDFICRRPAKTEKEKQMDLMNLKPVLREGKIVEERNKGVDLYTPIFRISFPKLDKPGTAKGYEDSKPKWNFQALFNFGKKDRPGFANPHPVYFKAIKDLAARTKTDVEGFEVDENGKALPIRKITSKHVTLLQTTAVAKNKNDEGEWRPGCGPGIFAASYSMYPNDDDLEKSDRPKLVDGKNRIILPREIQGGYWCRAYVQLYVSSYGAMCQGFTTVQLLAKDEVFGGGRPAGDMDEVEDADDFEERTEEDGIDDDMDLGDLE